MLSDKLEISAICDTDCGQLKAFQTKFPQLSCKVYSSYKDFIDKYKQENATFWSEQLGVGGDFDLKIEKEND